MAASDPTSGVGYAFGAKLPSTHMTTIATQQPRLLDIIDGGSYANDATVTITNATGIIRQLHLSGMALKLSQTSALNAELTIFDGTGSLTYENARQVTKRCNSPASLVCEVADTVAGTGDWSYGGIDNSGGSGLVPGTYCRQDYVNAGASTGGIISFDLTPLLEPGEVVSVSVYIDPAGAAVDPVHLPVIELVSITQAGAETVLDTVTDPGGGALIYRAGHLLTLDLGTAYDYNPDSTGETLILRFYGETGNNGTAGLLLYSIQATENISRLDHY